MKKPILTLLITIATISPIFAQGATGLNSERTKLDSNKQGAETVNYYCNSIVHSITTKGVLIGSENSLSLLIQVPAGLKDSLRPGMKISAWVRKAPKPFEYVNELGATMHVTLYGYLQPRDPDTKITKKNQQRVY